MTYREEEQLPPVRGEGQVVRHVHAGECPSSPAPSACRWWRKAARQAVMGLDRHRAPCKREKCQHAIRTAGARERPRLDDRPASHQSTKKATGRRDHPPAREAPHQPRPLLTWYALQNAPHEVRRDLLIGEGGQRRGRSGVAHLHGVMWHRLTTRAGRKKVHSRGKKHKATTSETPRRGEAAGEDSKPGRSRQRGGKRRYQLPPGRARRPPRLDGRAPGWPDRSQPRQAMTARRRDALTWRRERRGRGRRVVVVALGRWEARDLTMPSSQHFARGRWQGGLCGTSKKVSPLPATGAPAR